MTRRIQFAILAALLASAAGFAGGTFWPGGAPVSPDVLAALAGMIGAVLVVAMFRDDVSPLGLDATDSQDAKSAGLPVPYAQSSSQKPAPAPSRGFFDDLDLGPVVVMPEERGPSLDSVMFALASMDGEAPSGSQRAPVTMRPTAAPVAASAAPVASAPPAASPSPVAAAKTNSTPAPANAPRPIDRVASVSPFGPGTEHLKVEGSLSINAAEGTLGDLASAFDMADDQNDAVEAGRLEMARSGLSSIRARHSAGTNSMRAPSAASTSRSTPVAATSAPAMPAPAAQRPAQNAQPPSATGRIESVALMSEWFGSDDSEVIPQAAAPRSAPASGARPATSPFAPASAASRPVPVEMVAPSTPLASRNGRDEAAALNGLRSNRGSSSRPAVPVSAMANAWVPSLNKAPSAATALPELDVLDAAPATPIRRDRATSEQRVITARLQMGMLKNRTDSQQEFKKGQVPTPRKNAPGNLIMLSKRPDDFAEGTNSDDEIRQLYREFVSALNRCGRSTEIVQFQSFAQRIQSQRTKVRSQYQGVRINMAVRVTDGRPKIVMRPAM